MCSQIVHDLQLKVVGEPNWHQFAGPGGVTGMLLLTESHLTCQTYPEHGRLATFNLYCCRQRPQWPWQAVWASCCARHVTVRSVVRARNLPAATIEQAIQ